MHEGHRRRMYEKLKNDDGLHDHELLEILLYNAYPRINTNPVAHALIQTFGSLAGVFSADVESLVTVDGVGENVALYIKLVGEVMKRTNVHSSGIALLKNHSDFTNFIRARFRGKTAEIIELYMINKNGRLKRICPFTNGDVNKVDVNADDIMAAMAAERPYGVLAAHNHLSGSSNPSARDDKFTAELQLMCSINNIMLLDHMIYSFDENIFSYFLTGKLDEIKRECTFKSVMDEAMRKLNSAKR